MDSILLNVLNEKITSSGGDGCTIMPSCFGPQTKRCRREIVRIAYSLCQQPVFARCLIKRRHEKRVVDEIDALDEIAFDSCYREIQIVEGP